MKKYLLIIAAAAAAVAIVSCGKDNGKKIEPDSVEEAAQHQVAYFPLNSEADAIAVGEGITVAGLGGRGEFSTAGFKGGAYNNAAADHDTQAYLKLNVPKTFLSSLTSFTVTAWINAPSQRGGIITFDGGTDPNWGAWDLFFDGGDDQGTVLKGYFFNNGTEWGGFYPTYKGLEVAQNKWIHVTYTYDETTSFSNLYVNGVLVGPANEETGEITCTNACYAGPKPEEGEQPVLGPLKLSEVSCIYIGAFASRETGKSSESWLSYFGGKIDEVHIYNKALSDKQIMNVYKAEVLDSDIE